MLLTQLLLLPLAAASSLTIYVHSLPASDPSHSPIPSPIPLAQISYNALNLTATLASYTPPTGSYARDHFLRIGISDKGVTDGKSEHWRGVVTSAASFAQEYVKRFTVHVDEKGAAYHVGFSTSARGGGDEAEAGAEVEVEVVRRAAGPTPELNRPVVLNAEGKLDVKEPEKGFLQKYWWVVALFVLVQLVAGGKE